MAKGSSLRARACLQDTHTGCCGPLSAVHRTLVVYYLVCGLSNSLLSRMQGHGSAFDRFSWTLLRLLLGRQTLQHRDLSWSKVCNLHRELHRWDHSGHRNLDPYRLRLHEARSPGSTCVRCLESGTASFLRVYL